MAKKNFKTSKHASEHEIAQDSVAIKDLKSPSQENSQEKKDELIQSLRNQKNPTQTMLLSDSQKGKESKETPLQKLEKKRKTAAIAELDRLGMKTDENIEKINAIQFFNDKILIGKTPWAYENMKGGSGFFKIETNQHYYNFAERKAEAKKQCIILPKKKDFVDTLKALPGKYLESNGYKGGNILSIILGESRTGYCDSDGNLHFNDIFGYLGLFLDDYRYKDTIQLFKFSASIGEILDLDDEDNDLDDENSKEDSRDDEDNRFVCRPLVTNKHASEYEITQDVTAIRDLNIFPQEKKDELSQNLLDTKELTQTPQFETENHKIDTGKSKKEKLANGWKEEERPAYINGTETKIKVLKKELAPGAFVREYQDVRGMPKHFVGEQLFNWKAVLSLGLQDRLPRYEQMETMRGGKKNHKKFLKNNFQKDGKNLFPGYWDPNDETFTNIGDRTDYWLADNSIAVLIKNTMSHYDDDPEFGCSLRLLKPAEGR